MADIQLSGDIHFKIRFNTTHGTTNLYWRVIVGDAEYLATTLQCQVPTRSDASFDATANAIKYHMAGQCTQLLIDADSNAFFK